MIIKNPKKNAHHERNLHFFTDFHIFPGSWTKNRPHPCFHYTYLCFKV